MNAVVCYYAASARDGEITFEAGIHYPDGCPVSSTDITVLLENAMEFCKWEATGGPQTIKLRGKRRGDSTLLILVDNVTPVAFDGDTLLSSKREATGIGVGDCCPVQFEQKGGLFYAPMLLKFVPDGTGETVPAEKGAVPLKQ